MRLSITGRVCERERCWAMCNCDTTTLRKIAHLNVVRVFFAVAASLTVLRWLVGEAPITVGSLRAPASTAQQPAAEVERLESTVLTVEPPSTEQAGASESEFYRRRETKVSPFRHQAVLTPSRLCLDDTLIIILVHSHPAYRDRRDAIRTTWGSAVKSGWWPGTPRPSVPVRDLRLAFVVGLTVSEPDNTALREEYATHDDVVQGDFVDHYHNMTLKSLLGLKVVIELCPNVKYLLKVDDDTFINLPLLLSYLNSHSDLRRSIIGPHLPHQRVKRNGKWALTEQEFPFDFLPLYEAGSAYVITADVIGELFNTSEFVPHLFVDDLYVTGILGRIVGVSHVTGLPTSRDGSGRHVTAFAYVQSRPRNACDFARDRVYTGTNFRPRRLRNLWRRLVEGWPCTVRSIVSPINR